jgi:MYXO-CTERM domain-containing protein
MTAKRASFSLAVLCLLGLAEHASAHAPAKVLQYVSSAPKDIVIATNRGLIFGDLETRDFKLLCNEAYDVGAGEEDLRFVRTADRYFVASSNGLFESADRGCTWQQNEALKGQSVPSLAQHPSEPETLFVTTYATSEPYTGSIRVSRDGGKTFELLLQLENEYARTIFVIPGATATLYASNMVLNRTAPTYEVLRSGDGGKNWERFPVAITSEEADLSLLAVNAKQPNELIARATGAEPALGERLLWSSDGGRTFADIGKLPVIAHALFTADGSAFVASLDGVQRLTGSGAMRMLAPRGASERASRLLEREGELLASGYYQGIAAGRDGIGRAALTSLAFERFFDFSEVDEPVQCSPAVERKCRALWEDWARENLPYGASDGGVRDAAVGPSDAATGAPLSPDAATPGAGPSDGGAPSGSDAGGDKPMADESADGGGGDGGCRVASSNGPSTWWLSLLALALVRRRRQ